MHNISTKKLFLIFFILFFLWKNGVQEFLWQKIYASARAEYNEEELPLVEVITPIETPVIEQMKFGKETVQMKKIIEYKAWARVMYVDIYDHDFYIGFKPLSAKYDIFYNTVVPLDISLFTGEIGKNWKKYKVSHEYRALWVGHGNLPYNQKEVSNNHTIPANNNIRRAFDIMKQGRVVYLEGYWVDWWGKVDGIYDINFDSPREIGQYHDMNHLYGGLISGKCRQIYITKVVYNGYIYE